jgi:hypothetical protein
MKTNLVSMTAILLFCGCGGEERAGARDPSGAGADMNAGCPAAWTATPSADASIAVPASGGAVLLHVLATGTQNYACRGTDVDAGDGKAYAWTLVAPAAQLADCGGAIIGMHSAPTGAAAPQWTNSDGSVVVGRRVAAYTPDAQAIPWLLLAASSHSDTGVMSRVTYVQRLHTSGGVASGTCDADHAGATSEIPYSADYYFFGN